MTYVALVIESGIPGLVKVSGNVLGETGGQAALTLPVNASCDLWLEFLPGAAGYLPMARKLSLRDGALIPENVAAMEGVNAVEWPGGVIQLELSPDVQSPAPALAVDAGHGLSLLAQGERLCVYSQGQPVLCQPLPGPAQPLTEGELALLGDWLLVCARLTNGRVFVLALSAQESTIQVRMSELCDRVTLEEGVLTIYQELNDVAGHGLESRYEAGAEGIRLTGSEIMWAEGGPRWPATAEDTAIAAMQALRLSLADEARGYFTEGAWRTLNAATLGAYDACVPLAFPVGGGRIRGAGGHVGGGVHGIGAAGGPGAGSISSGGSMPGVSGAADMSGLPSAGGAPSVGLLSVIGGNHVRVRALPYRAEPGDGAQGPWRISAIG